MWLPTEGSATNARSGTVHGATNRWRRLAWGANVALRLVILGFAVEALLAGDDPRFSGKGIQVRDLVLAGLALTAVVPVLHLAQRRRMPYPVAAECLLLSILALDMAGNSLSLYGLGWRFDLIPHSYGPGAGIAALHLVGVGWLTGGVIVNGLHLLLEAQEALGDMVFQTQNVHGAWDTATDLAAGLFGSLGVPLAWRHLRGDRRAGSMPLQVGHHGSVLPHDHATAPSGPDGPSGPSESSPAPRVMA